MSPPNVYVFDTPQDLAEATAKAFAQEANRSIRENGRFAVALAGGSTPKASYELLAARYLNAIDWARIHVFFSDERTVPPNHEDSNYHMAYEALLSRAPAGSVHRLRGELEPSEAAILYEKELTTFFDGPPRFDLVLLGVGEDGHTASLFPRTPALNVNDRWAVENPVQKLHTTRLTLTVPTINTARQVTFLVAGEGKAQALKEVLEGDAHPRDCPAKLVRPVGSPDWFVDRAAASLLGDL